MPISLVEVYQVIADVARQAQESEAKAQALAQQVQRLEETVRLLQETARTLVAERDRYKAELLTATTSQGNARSGDSYVSY